MNVSISIYPIHISATFLGSADPNMSYYSISTKSQLLLNRFAPLLVRYERLQISRDQYYLTIIPQEAEGAAAAAEPRQHAHRLLPRGLHRPPLLRSATPYIPI